MFLYHVPLVAENMSKRGRSWSINIYDTGRYHRRRSLLPLEFRVKLCARKSTLPGKAKRIVAMGFALEGSHEKPPSLSWTRKNVIFKWCCCCFHLKFGFPSSFTMDLDSLDKTKFSYHNLTGLLSATDHAVQVTIQQRYELFTQNFRKTTRTTTHTPNPSKQSKPYFWPAPAPHVGQVGQPQLHLPLWACVCACLWPYMFLAALWYAFPLWSNCCGVVGAQRSWFVALFIYFIPREGVSIATDSRAGQPNPWSKFSKRLIRFVLAFVP